MGNNLCCFHAGFFERVQKIRRKNRGYGEFYHTLMECQYRESTIFSNGFILIASLFEGDRRASKALAERVRPRSGVLKEA